MHLFEDVPKERLQEAIALVEASLFAACRRRVDNAAPTLPGFTARLQEGVPYYQVHIDTRILKV